MAISLMRKCLAAFSSCFNNICTIVCCIEAQISHKFFSIKSASSFFLSLKKYKIAVFRPLKLKLKAPFALGCGNLNAKGLPCWAYLSTRGPPGYSKPSNFADLSNASPAASSMVSPTTLIFKGLSTRTICVCPPETVKHKKGNLGCGSSIKCAKTCACIWLTVIIGMFKPKAKALAKEAPTISEPISPGPSVKATALNSSFCTPARFNAASTTGIIFCWCARDANSGTTPPYSLCTAWFATTLLSTTPSFSTAAEVSSQEDSMANMVIGLLIFLNCLLWKKKNVISRLLSQISHLSI